MRRCFYLLPLLLLFSPSMFAQESDHIDIGAFGNFLHVNDTSTNLAGIGARISVNVVSHAQLELESSYNFARTFSSTSTTPTSAGTTVSVNQSSLRSFDMLAGPKIMTSGGHARLFATVKGGFIDYTINNPALNPLNTSFQNIGGSSTYGVVYPAVGAEAFLGIIGLRAEVGDEIWFRNGGHNALRVTFGPVLRF
jgi:hypothetical protein